MSGAAGSRPRREPWRSQTISVEVRRRCRTRPHRAHADATATAAGDDETGLLGGRNRARARCRACRGRGRGTRRNWRRAGRASVATKRPQVASQCWILSTRALRASESAIAASPSRPVADEPSPTKDDPETPSTTRIPPVPPGRAIRRRRLLVPRVAERGVISCEPARHAERQEGAERGLRHGASRRRDRSLSPRPGRRFRCRSPPPAFLRLVPPMVAQNEVDPKGSATARASRTRHRPANAGPL